jgi:lantibiotic modifying enzyme
LRTAGRRETSRCRLLYRPTGHYHSFLQGSCCPALLRNTLSRSRFLQQACQRPHVSSSVARREVEALRDLDIPFLIGRARRAALKPLSGRAVRDATRLIVRSLSAAQKTAIGA